MDVGRCCWCEGRLDRPGLCGCTEPPHPPPDLARGIASALMMDLDARHGFHLDGVEEDVQHEMHATWTELIRIVTRKFGAWDPEIPWQPDHDG